MQTLIIPAIDLRGGKCVRLYQGEYSKEQVYFDNPVEMACLWRVQNAKFLHVVDLDAARGDVETNQAIIEAICNKLDIPVQVGGGIRTMADIDRVISVGVSRLVLGTAAARTPELVSEAVAKYGASKIAVGIDAKNGEVRVNGWLEGTGTNAIDFALDMEARGCRRFVYTDISRDGTLEGPNIPMYRQLAERLGRSTRITASGGVGRYQDLIALGEIYAEGIDSVIVGRALYENAFPCQQFWCWHQKDSVDLDTFSSAQMAQDPAQNAR